MAVDFHAFTMRHWCAADARDARCARGHNAYVDCHMLLMLLLRCFRAMMPYYVAWCAMCAIVYAASLLLLPLLYAAMLYATLLLLRYALHYCFIFIISLLMKARLLSSFLWFSPAILFLLCRCCCFTMMLIQLHATECFSLLRCWCFSLIFSSPYAADAAISSRCCRFHFADADIFMPFSLLLISLMPFSISSFFISISSMFRCFLFISSPLLLLALAMLMLRFSQDFRHW